MWRSPYGILRRPGRDEEGQSTVDYVLLILFLALVVLAAVETLGRTGSEPPADGAEQVDTLS